MKRTREEPEIRKELILAAAIRMAAKHGYQSVTREMVANEAGISPGLVSVYFYTMAHLKRAIMKAAIDREILPIIAQGISLNDPLTRQSSPTIKRKIKALFD